MTLLDCFDFDFWVIIFTYKFTYPLFLPFGMNHGTTPPIRIQKIVTIGTTISAPIFLIFLVCFVCSLWKTGNMERKTQPWTWSRDLTNSILATGTGSVIIYGLKKKNYHLILNGW